MRARLAPQTINKSQGQTLPFVGLYLPRHVFGHGQLYVGLSRVGDPHCIKVFVKDTSEQGRVPGREGVWTVNIVYPEVLAEARRMLHRTSQSANEAGCSADGPRADACEPCDDDDDCPMPETTADGDHEDTEGGMSRAAVWSLAHRSTQMPPIPDEMADPWDGE